MRAEDFSYHPIKTHYSAAGVAIRYTEIQQLVLKDFDVLFHAQRYGSIVSN